MQSVTSYKQGRDSQHIERTATKKVRGKKRTQNKKNQQQYCLHSPCTSCSCSRCGQSSWDGLCPQGATPTQLLASSRTFNPPRIFQLNTHCEMTPHTTSTPKKGSIKCPYTNPSPFPSTFPQGIWHLSSVSPQVTRTVPQVSPHATGTTQLYSHAQERTKL